MTDERKPAFWHGVFAGFAAFVVLVQGVLASQLGDLETMYREFGSTPLPTLTRITIQPAWIFGTPLVGAALVAALLVKRPRSAAPYIAVSVIVVIVALMTYWYPRAPIYALAGNISAN
jgi:hypothetical protein